ncbi:uncharacterized protein LOC119505250 [Choloepus didactylus]|uniref:uncharacterized protein LOC119505250 n=1 Tax=Choloepus didactylus TaxID=27675 RepID=UPI00189FC76D|nr:uncharacterized protein LOC119505250 [Choloepus didactylus]
MSLLRAWAHPKVPRLVLSTWNQAETPPEPMRKPLTESPETPSPESESLPGLLIRHQSQPVLCKRRCSLHPPTTRRVSCPSAEVTLHSLTCANPTVHTSANVLVNVSESMCHGYVGVFVNKCVSECECVGVSVSVSVSVSIKYDMSINECECVGEAVPETDAARQQPCSPFNPHPRGPPTSLAPEGWRAATHLVSQNLRLVNLGTRFRKWGQDGQAQPIFLGDDDGIGEATLLQVAKHELSAGTRTNHHICHAVGVVQDGGSRGPPLGERKKRSTVSRRKRPRLHLEKPQAPFAARTAASAQRTPGAPGVRAAPRPPRSGLRRAEAVTFVPGVRAGAPQQGAIFPSLSRAGAGGCAAGTRRGTHRPGEEGERRNRPSGRHSPRRSLAARARTPPRPGAPSAAAAGEGDSQVAALEVMKLIHLEVQVFAFALEDLFLAEVVGDLSSRGDALVVQTDLYSALVSSAPPQRSRPNPAPFAPTASNPSASTVIFDINLRRSVEDTRLLGQKQRTFLLMAHAVARTSSGRA